MFQKSPECITINFSPAKRGWNDNWNFRRLPQKDFHHLLVIVEKKHALRKLKLLLDMQVRNEIELLCNDKSDDKACAVVDAIVLVVLKEIKKLLKNCYFRNLSGDASEARFIHGFRTDPWFMARQ